MCENAFLENLLESSRNPVGILLDSRSPVGIGGGVISTAKSLGYSSGPSELFDTCVRVNSTQQ